MKARRRREYKAIGQLAVLRAIRVRNGPQKERLLKMLVKSRVKLIRDDGTKVLEAMFSCLGIAVSKNNSPLLAVNGNIPIYADPMEPGLGKEKVKSETLLSR